MVSHDSAISWANIEFIIVWKVAGEFVSSKNITIGSYKPWFMRKAAFHLSPSLIWILLYPHQMLNLMYSEHPLRWSTSCSMSGKGYLFYIVHWFTGQ